MVQKFCTTELCVELGVRERKESRPNIEIRYKLYLYQTFLLPFFESMYVF